MLIGMNYLIQIKTENIDSSITFLVKVLRTPGYVGYEKLSLLIHVPASLFRKEKIMKYLKPSESNDQVAQ